MRSLLAAQVKLHEVSAHRARVSSPTRATRALSSPPCSAPASSACSAISGPGARSPGSSAVTRSSSRRSCQSSPARRRWAASRAGSRSFGYLGGLVSLGICLAYISASQQSGRAALFVPMTMLITAGSFAVAATPTFRRRFAKFFFLLGCSQAGQPLHGSSQAARSSAISRAAVARRRVPRAMGAFSQGGVDLRTADLRRGEPDLRRQPPPRQPGDAHLLRHWPCASRRVRPQGGARHGNRHEVRPSTDTLQRT